MQRFLQCNGVKEDYFGPSLILRTFLQMMEVLPHGVSKSAGTAVDNTESDSVETIMVAEEDDEPFEDSFDESDDDIDYFDYESDPADIVRDTVAVEGKQSSRLTTQRKQRRRGNGPKYPEIVRTCRTNKCGCEKVFSTLQEKQQHYMEKRFFECKTCDPNIPFPSQKAFRKHRSEVHKVERVAKTSNSGVRSKPARKTKNPDGLYYCSATTMCKELFADIKSRDEHVRSVKHFKCDSCVVWFDTMKEFKTHRNEDPTCKSFTCPICQRNFQKETQTVKTTFKDHVLACENNRTFICDICGQSFNQERRLKKHRLVHTEVREQKRLLSSLNNQARSEALRKNPRNFSCDQCDRSYTTNQRLKFHKISAHGDGSKLKCPYCPKELMNGATLNNHIKRIHEKDSSPPKKKTSSNSKRGLPPDSLSSLLMDQYHQYNQSLLSQAFSSSHTN